MYTAGLSIEKIQRNYTSWGHKSKLVVMEKTFLDKSVYEFLSMAVSNGK
jgi:hypothetical protein